MKNFLYLPGEKDLEKEMIDLGLIMPLNKKPNFKFLKYKLIRRDSFWIVEGCFSEKMIDKLYTNFKVILPLSTKSFRIDNKDDMILIIKILLSEFKWERNGRLSEMRPTELPGPFYYNKEENITLSSLPYHEYGLYTEINIEENSSLNKDNIFEQIEKVFYSESDSIKNCNFKFKNDRVSYVICGVFPGIVKVFQRDEEYSQYIDYFNLTFLEEFKSYEKENKSEGGRI